MSASSPSSLAPPSASLGGASGAALHAFVSEILPLRRCVTGDGLRQTLRAIGEHVPLRLTEVASGTPVLDWTVPDEWRVASAYLAVGGRRVVDWAESPLHLVQCSVPVRRTTTLADLRPHLHTLPDQPDLVPYRTAYYAPAWGFCLAQATLDALAAEIGEGGEVEVVVDAEHVRGSLSYGEVVVPGADGGRGPALGARLPPGARQRQRLVAGGRDRARPAPARRAGAAAHRPGARRARHRRRRRPGSTATASAWAASATGWCSPTSATAAA